MINADLTPGFPIVVIKENERVRIKTSKSNKNSRTADTNGFEYLVDNFDPDASTQFQNIGNNSGLDPRLIDAYNVWESFGPGGWQRDNIYY